MRFNKTFAAIALSIAGLAVGGCGSDDDGGASSSGGGSSGATADKQLNVTVLMTGFQHPYLTSYMKAMRDEAAKRNMKVTLLDGQFKADLQAQQFATAISQKPDGIIVFPSDPKGIIPSAARAKAAGIPLVFSNAEIDPSGEQYSTAFTGPNNYQQGKDQFDLISKAIGGKGNVAIEELYAGGAANVERLKGFKDRQKETGQPIKLAASEHHDGDVAKAKNIANTWITRFGAKLNGIIGQDDNGAVGAAQAAKEAGFTGKIKVIGNGAQKDALEMIKAGEMYGTLEQKPTLDGSLPVIVMDAVLRKKPFEKKTYLPIKPITKDNVDQFTAEW
jgi:ABC-type sugar transport system substrate-binding protein